MDRVRSKILQRVDLRFGPEDEARFVAHEERKLVISTAFLSVLYASSSALTLTLHIRSESSRPENPYTWLLFDPRTFRFLILGLPLCLGNAILLLCCWCWLYHGLLRHFNWELVLTSMTTVVVLVLCVGNQYTVAKLYGRDPRAVWTDVVQGSEGSLALTLDAITTALCLFVPVRMHLKWIPPVVGMLGFFVCFGILGSPIPGMFPLNLARLFALTSCALWGAFRTERESRENYIAQLTVQRKSSQLEVQHVGASRILDRLCDVLFVLGSDFKICESSPRLTAMLLSPYDVKGRTFCDFIACEDDRCRFVKALQHEDGLGEPTSSNMVQIILRDHHGRAFSVYTYHARTFGLAGEECGYLVALIEVQERASPDSIHEVGMLPSVKALGESMEASEPSSGSEVASIPLASERHTDVAVWINTVSGNYEISRCSVGFTIFGPMGGGASFIELIEDPTAFERWLQLELNEEQFHRNAPPREHRLKIRSSLHALTEFHATCAVDFESFEWEDEAEENLVCLVFHGITCHKRRRKSKQILNQRVASLETASSIHSNDDRSFRL